MENTVGSEKLIACNEEMKCYLLESAKWCKFLAIVGYIGLAFLILFYRYMR
jgi:hypothetical protein